MSKQLIEASLNLDLAKGYNPAQDAVEEIGKAVDSYTKYQEQQSEKAYQIAENLQEAKELIIKEFKTNYLKDHFNMSLSEQELIKKMNMKMKKNFL